MARRRRQDDVRTELPQREDKDRTLYCQFSAEVCTPELVTRSKQELDRFELQLNQDLDLMDLHPSRSLAENAKAPKDGGGGWSFFQASTQRGRDDAGRWAGNRSRCQSQAAPCKRACHCSNPALAAKNVSRKRPSSASCLQSSSPSLMNKHRLAIIRHLTITRPHRSHHQLNLTRHLTPWETKTQSLRAREMQLESSRRVDAPGGPWARTGVVWSDQGEPSERSWQSVCHTCRRDSLSGTSLSQRR